MAGDADNWYRVAIFAAGACVISAIAVLSGPKATHRIPTREVGVRTAAPAGGRVSVGVA
jgi:hypothetical protein